MNILLWNAKFPNGFWVFEDKNVLVAVRNSRSARNTMKAVIFNNRKQSQLSLTLNSACLKSSNFLKTYDHIQFFQNNNPLSHCAKACTDYLITIKLKLLENSPLSPSLAPWDLALSPYVKMKIKGTARENECTIISSEIWQMWFKDWLWRMERCIAYDEKYFEKILINLYYKTSLIPFVKQFIPKIYFKKQILKCFFMVYY